MDKGYYDHTLLFQVSDKEVAIHNKNGQGLLQHIEDNEIKTNIILSQSTIKMDKGYYRVKNE
jgi:hypothetical protein